MDYVLGEYPRKCLAILSVGPKIGQVRQQVIGQGSDGVMAQRNWFDAGVCLGERVREMGVPEKDVGETENHASCHHVTMWLGMGDGPGEA